MGRRDSIIALLALFLAAGEAAFGRRTSSVFQRAAVFGLPNNRIGTANLQSGITSGILDIRGGSEDEYDEYDFDDEEEDDDDFLFDLDDADMMEDDDFSEDTTLDRAMEAWKKTPPVTKAYLSMSGLCTLYGYLANKNQFPPILMLDWQKVVKKLQIWRLFTGFLNVGPLGLGYAMTAQFVWTYMSTLERLHHDRPFDFLIMIVFAQCCMVLGYPLLKMSPRFLGHNLSTFLVYVWSRYHEGLEVNMFELFNTRAEMLPWFFLAQTFLLEGELPTLDFLGIVFGHIYHHCKTVGILRAPESLVSWYNGESSMAKRIRQTYKHITADFEV